MATSKLFAAIDGLVALCRGTSALNGVGIFDGPMVLESEDETGSNLFIGAVTDDTDTSGVTATSDQDFGPFGNGARDENLAIFCIAEAWSGDTDIKAVRDRVKAIVAAVEDLTHQNVAGADVTLQGAVLWSRVTNIALRQSQTDQGAEAVATFLVAGRARL
jgi:hypothetical protein